MEHRDSTPIAAIAGFDGHDGTGGDATPASGSGRPGYLRTLQRRFRDWRALEGPEREIYFPQEHTPGRQGLSDYTDAAELGITIAGALLVHRPYQFVLAYSGWRHVEVVLGGESFVSLSTGLQNALWRMGGVPEEHRTDHLTAAYNNQREHEELTRRYDALCKDYGLRASTNNLGESQENSSIEARPGSGPHATRLSRLSGYGPGLWRITHSRNQPQ